MVSDKTADVARRAKQLYESTLRTKLEATNRGDYVAIEPDSGDYFVGETLSQAIQASRISHPERLAFGMRIGYDEAVHLGVLTP